MCNHEFVKTTALISGKETWYCLHCQVELIQMSDFQSKTFREVMMKKCKEIIDSRIRFTHVTKMLSHDTTAKPPTAL